MLVPPRHSTYRTPGSAPPFIDRCCVSAGGRAAAAAAEGAAAPAAAAAAAAPAASASTPLLPAGRVMRGAFDQAPPLPQSTVVVLLQNVAVAPGTRKSTKRGRSSRSRARLRPLLTPPLLLIHSMPLSAHSISCLLMSISSALLRSATPPPPTVFNALLDAQSHEPFPLLASFSIYAVNRRV